MKVIQINTERLRQQAEDERWSDRLIAKKVGLTPMGVSNIMRGKVDPAATNLKKICDTIGLPIEEAFIETVVA